MSKKFRLTSLCKVIFVLPNTWLDNGRPIVLLYDTYFNILAPLGENAMNVGASPFNSSSVVVSWSPPQTPQGVITSYIVYKYQPPLSLTAVRAAEVPGSQRQGVVAELTPYTEYKFTVKACNSFACSGHSPEALARTLPAGMLNKIIYFLFSLQ